MIARIPASMTNVIGRGPGRDVGTCSRSGPSVIEWLLPRYISLADLPGSISSPPTEYGRDCNKFRVFPWVTSVSWLLAGRWIPGRPFGVRQRDDVEWENIMAEGLSGEARKQALKARP